MDFCLDRQQAEFLDSLRSYLDGLDVEAVEAETESDEETVGPAGYRFLRQMGADGWMGVGWPTEYGGKGRSAIEQWLFREELSYRGLVDGGVTVSSMGPTIMRVGTEEQKRLYLPGILAGEVNFAAGYSEPNAGSDLASLETRAKREGDEYVINGQKIYITGAHFATHIWLSVRTGTREMKHRGISIIIVPLDTPGISVRPLQTQADVRTNEVFFDDVRVPVTNRIGEENAGWRIIGMALDFERILPFSKYIRDFEDLVQWAANTAVGSTADPADGEGKTVAQDPVGRQRLAELAVDLDVTRLFAMRAAWMIEQGQVPHSEASILKVWMTEMQQRLFSGALDLMGEAGQLRYGTAEAPLRGRLEAGYRLSTLSKFGAGTNEVQRNIIAQRGLGLPR